MLGLFGTLDLGSRALQAQQQGLEVVADHPQLTTDENNILSQISQNGIVQSRPEAASSLMTDRVTALNKQGSDQADADLATTMVQFSAAQNAYQVAVQSGAKLINMPSLLDYLQ